MAGDMDPNEFALGLAKLWSDALERAAQAEAVGDLAAAEHYRQVAARTYRLMTKQGLSIEYPEPKPPPSKD